MTLPSLFVRNLCRAGIVAAGFAFVQLACGQSLVIQDGGTDRPFEVALDEVSIVRNGKREAMQVSAADLPALAVRAKAERSKEKTLNTTADVELVVYEAGASRTVRSRRFVTKKLLVQFSPGQDAKALAAGLPFKLESVPSYAPHMAILTVDSSERALEAMAQLRANPMVAKADVLLARWREKKLIPNDPLFGQQWHLRNTTQGGGSLWIDCNVSPVWDTFRGNGVTVAIVDDGVEYIHPDLAANYNTAIDIDYNGDDNDAAPAYTGGFDNKGDTHGTSCAGIVGARGNNGLGVAGVAYEAALTGIRLIAAENTDAEEAQAFDYLGQVIQVKSNSWGPPDIGETLEAPGTLAAAALLNAVTNGRGGLGTIIVFAAGNGLAVQDNSNYDGYANSICTIAVSAVNDDGFQSWYSEPGANIAVCAPSNGGGHQQGSVTTDLTGENGENRASETSDLADRNYTKFFGGTSSACPVVAGVTALMLQANPNLGWRDVKEILMRTARRNHHADSDWITNGAGIQFNHKYGAGLVDAEAAVTLAQNWTNLGPWKSEEVNRTGLADVVADTTTVTKTFSITTANRRVESVAVKINLIHDARGDLEVILTSPSGTSSVLATPHEDYNNDYANWTFTTVRNWGETAAGTWTLTIRDRRAENSGVLTSAKLTVYGSDVAAPRVVAQAVGAPSFEGNLPANTAVDPGETVTFNFGLKNIGGTAAGNVTATLLNLGGVVNSSPAQNYGSLPVGGSYVSKPFTFAAHGSSGHATKAVLRLDNGGVFLGYATVQIPLGKAATATFNGGPLAIDEIAASPPFSASPHPSTISVTGTGRVQNVKAKLVKLSHTYAADLRIYLRCPDALNMALLTSAAGDALFNVDLTFDDGAAMYFPWNGSASGTYKPWDFDYLYDPPGYSFPQEPATDERGLTLGEFNGLNANGEWRLYVDDWGAGDVGTINSWNVEITSVSSTDNIFLAATTLTALESAGTLQVAVTRTGGREGAATVNYATAPGTATPGSDYTAVSGTLTFLPGEKVKTFGIPLSNDAQVEVDETVLINLSSATGGSTLGSATSATATIANDDFKPEIAVEFLKGTAVADGGTSAHQFGAAINAYTSSGTGTIRNFGMAPLTGLSLSIEGTDSADFQLGLPAIAATLAPNESTDFTVQFKPAQPGAKSAILRILSNDDDESPYDITLTGQALSAMEYWRFIHFGSTAATGDAADLADPDHDGVTNFMEHALNTDPKLSSKVSLEVVRNGANLEVTYSRRKWALGAGIAFIIEWSDTLAPGSWSTADVTESILEENTLSQTVKAVLPAGTGTARFVRLRVSGN